MAKKRRTTDMSAITVTRASLRPARTSTPTQLLAEAGRNLTSEQRRNQQSADNLAAHRAQRKKLTG